LNALIKEVSVGNPTARIITKSENTVHQEPIHIVVPNLKVDVLPYCILQADGKLNLTAKVRLVFELVWGDIGRVAGWGPEVLPGKVSYRPSASDVIVT